MSNQSKIQNWMALNSLQINADKTEVICFGTRKQLKDLKSITNDNIVVNSESFNIVNFVRNLGFYMDSELKNSYRASKLCSELYLKIRNISNVRKNLTKEAASILIQSIVVSKLDYCNSQFLGSSELIINRLQKIQNMCCRVVCKLRRYDHVTDHLKTLHWLKVKYRIDFKILLFMFKCIHGSAPSYLKDLLEHKQHYRSLRKSSKRNFQPILTRTIFAQNSLFASAGTKLWNQLPLELRLITDESVFKNKLKTFLFRICYELN